MKLDFGVFTSRKYLLACAGLLCFVASNIVAAESKSKQPTQCNTEFIPSYLLAPLPKSGTTTRTENIDVTSDKAYVEKGQIFHFEGNVQLKQTDQILNADNAVYYKEQKRIDAQGNIRYQTNNHVVTGNEAHIDIPEDKAEISNPEFWLIESHLRGKAATVDVHNKNNMLLKSVEFTSCDKDEEDWKLRASELQLDQLENEGIAYNARIEFMHIPFIYLPYMSFPLSGRKTGFLVPSVGSSTASGNEIAIPYYFNLAPNYDATFTPRYYDKRGTQYLGEYRYLLPHSAGQMELEYLPNDRLSKTDRTYASYNHHGTLAGGWTTSLLYQYASDSNYFDEFANSLSSSSVANLERHLSLNYITKAWAFKSSVQSYQTLDETIAATSRPYEKRPQLQFVVNPYELPYGLETSATTEYVNFYRAEGVTGDRTDIMPQITWHYREAAGFLQPTLKLRHTRYDLYDQDPSYDSQTSRTLPMFSVDSGLYFDRDVTLSDDKLLQTLEPRLYYLYVPYRNQDELIVNESGNPITFDSSLPPFNFSDLFRDNRFAGVDRVGDANQLSAALTSRLLTETGAEWLRANVGMIYYFHNREVTLPNGPVETSRQSDLAAELYSNWNQHIESNASLLWGQENNNVARGSMQLRYTHEREKIINLSYRYERDQINQADLSVLWRIQQRWKGVYRWYYSFLNDIKLETTAGLEYESCCWAIRLVRRDYVSDLGLLGEQRNLTFWIQLELKGLASVGSKVDTAFETGLFTD